MKPVKVLLFLGLLAAALMPAVKAEDDKCKTPGQADFENCLNRCVSNVDCLIACSDQKKLAEEECSQNAEDFLAKDNRYKYDGQ